jgi:hypothetical protein
MVSVTTKICQAEGCKTRPSFNVAGKKSPIYCVAHRDAATMVNVVDKTCREPSCQKRPSFNFPNHGRGVYCAAHAQEGMIDVHNQKNVCVEPLCTKRPLFNFANEERGKYCFQHKEPLMVNVTRPKCHEPGCQTTPTFNYEKEQKPLFCAKHKREKMVNIRCIMCKQPECKIRACFGLVGLQPSCCSLHREDQMLYNPRRRCESDECKEIATWGVRSVAERCDAHKQPTDRDLVTHRCIVCDKPDLLNQDKQCPDCDTRGVNIRLGRQRQVKAAIDAASLPAYHTYDRVAFDNTSCGKERPDFAWDCGSYWLMLEIDEDQHKSRPCECEQTRMVNVTQGIAMPCLWVRYNPDEYKGQKVTIRDKHRLDYLVRFLREQLNAPPEDTAQCLRVYHLFFDGFNITETPTMQTIPCI